MKKHFLVLTTHRCYHKRDDIDIPGKKYITEKFLVLLPVSIKPFKPIGNDGYPDISKFMVMFKALTKQYPTYFPPSAEIFKKYHGELGLIYGVDAAEPYNPDDKTVITNGEFIVKPIMFYLMYHAFDKPIQLYENRHTLRGIADIVTKDLTYIAKRVLKVNGKVFVKVRRTVTCIYSADELAKHCDKLTKEIEQGKTRSVRIFFNPNNDITFSWTV